MRHLTRMFVVVAAALSVAPAAAENYPTRPIRLYVAFPPGGAADIVARLVAQPLSARLGQPVVVENKPGSGGNIAGELIAHAAPDGYSLLIGPATCSPSIRIFSARCRSTTGRTSSPSQPSSRMRWCWRSTEGPRARLRNSSRSPAAATRRSTLRSATAHASPRHGDAEAGGGHQAHACSVPRWGPAGIAVLAATWPECSAVDRCSDGHVRPTARSRRPAAKGRRTARLPSISGSPNSKPPSGGAARSAAARDIIDKVRKEWVRSSRAGTSRTSWLRPVQASPTSRRSMVKARIHRDFEDTVRSSEPPACRCTEPTVSR